MDQAARIVAMKELTSPRSFSASRDRPDAASSTCVAASPVSDAA
jgi:hypothetical protein